MIEKIIASILIFMVALLMAALIPFVYLAVVPMIVTMWKEMLL